MKIRTLSQLEQYIDSDLAKRKRSLTTLKFLFDGSQSKQHENKVISLAGLCLIYGHWEGFVKYSGMCYTNYVSSQGLDYKSLSNGMVAVCFRTKLSGVRSSNKISLNREIVEILREHGNEKPTIPWKAAIETYDNLNSEVLTEILIIIGCDPTEYATRFAFIDEKLIKFRNSIAHTGYDYEYESNDFLVIYSGVLSLLERFRNDVQDAANRKAYAI